MPNRIIKESICTSDSVDKLSWFEETVFYRLIVNCDDYGRFDARPAILRSRLFPLKSVTDKQIESALESLRTAGIVCLYEVDGKPYLQLRTWENHQSIRAKKSRYPAPDSGKTANENICIQMQADASKCPRNPIQSESESESNPTREMSIKSCAKFYEQTFGTPLPGALSSEIIFRIGTGTDEKLVMEALKLCYGKDNPATYFAKVLQNWCAKGISTYQDYCKSNCTQTQQPYRQDSKLIGIEGLEEL